MDRWGRMCVRAFVPTALLFAATLVSTWPLNALRDNPFTAGLFDLVRWIPLLGFATTVSLASWTTYRLWQWEQGNALTCDCGGLLGRERSGVRGRGDYRRCLACGRCVNHRFYE